MMSETTCISAPLDIVRGMWLGYESITHLPVRLLNHAKPVWREPCVSSQY